MKSLNLLLFILVLLTHSANGQDTLWSQADKRKLIDNFTRTRNEVNSETSNLTTSQWNFKETPNSWSVAEVLEHLNMWQLLTQGYARNMESNGPRPELAKICASDSVNTTFIYEEKKHVSPNLTIPTGNIPDQANLKLFNTYCDRIISNITKSNLNFRLYFRTFTDGYVENMNQAYIIQYGHVDRHLRQIRRIKSNRAFPKK